MTPPIQKNEYIDVVFEDMTHEGAGVAKINGYPIFVPNGLPGEQAEVKVIKVNKNFAFGRLIELKTESPYRQEPPCPVYKQCGGCQMQHMTYEGQLKMKEKQVRDVMQRIGKLTNVSIHPVLGMEEPWSYRNKAQVPIGESEAGLIAGFYRKGTHDIIDMNKCLIQMELNDELVQEVKSICNQFGIQAYDEASHKGTLRHVMARYGATSGEIMIVLITRKAHLPHRDEIINELVTKFPSIKSIVQNVNDKRTNVIFGDKTTVLYGSEYIYDRIGNVQFAISARSFYQVNPVQTKVLYDKALEYANLTGEETVIDAYCGIGTISLFLAQQAKKVYGVEIVKEAIEDANRNAELNGMTNVEFAVGEAEKVIPNWYKQGISADVIVVDPPRKGCGQELLDTIIAMKPKRVVYVSCNPGTLARDLRILEDGGFETKEIQPVDMFPQTMHVECCALIERIEE
ncbi:23S rRNA (uracil(1939)-C(5))-methyltransferase RlmD [Ectobacillus polymachus]|uniref:23S rRNA (uracil(1939)-C(5))-methyltransferase RlmD n=1 Tax=Ectobacillus polymachus TaxID=1508806 RepID=UPI003A865BB7